MSSPYRVRFVQPKPKQRAFRVPLSTIETMDKIGKALVRHYAEMELIYARESFRHNERRFERKMARIKKGLAY